mmetsp:Transcript_21015/g.54733  ORF Transcript_21015/g.54733 Transcript_21015/m.54733 type:complete len:222 (+) Transcript_21015:1855-2520(+)
MKSNDADCFGILGIGRQVVADVGTAIFGHKGGGSEPCIIKRFPQRLGVCRVGCAFVPNADVVNIDVVHILGPLHPFHNVRRREIRVGEGATALLRSSNPSRISPGETVGLDIGVALLCLGQHPPLVSSMKVQVVGRVHVAGLGTIGALRVATNLNLDQLKRGTKAGLEEVVQHLRPRGLWIVDKQASRRPATRQAAEAVEGNALTIVDVDRKSNILGSASN